MGPSAGQEESTMGFKALDKFLQIFVNQFTYFPDHQSTIDIPTQGEYVYFYKPVKVHESDKMPYRKLKVKLISLVEMEYRMGRR